MAKNQATEEQLKYAGILDAGMKIGFVVLCISFALYITGVMTPHVPIKDLPKYWTMPVKEYLKATDIHPGWSWLHHVGKGDFSNFIGIGFLAGVTIICYLAIIPIFIKKKDTTFLIIAILEVLVLLLASSGVLRAGGH